MIDVRPEEWAQARAMLAPDDDVVSVDRTVRPTMYLTTTRASLRMMNAWYTRSGVSALAWAPGALGLLDVEPSTRGLRAWMVVYTQDHRAVVVGLSQIDSEGSSAPNVKRKHHVEGTTERD